MRYSIVVVACVACFGLAACTSEKPGAAVSYEGAPVILISVDTLRADRLPAYGYTGVQTPLLDALAKESVLFENAYTHVPLTLPAHVTILTGHPVSPKCPPATCSGTSRDPW